MRDCSCLKIKVYSSYTYSEQQMEFDATLPKNALSQRPMHSTNQVHILEHDVKLVYSLISLFIFTFSKQSQKRVLKYRSSSLNVQFTPLHVLFVGVVSSTRAPLLCVSLEEIKTNIFVSSPVISRVLIHHNKLLNGRENLQHS